MYKNPLLNCDSYKLGHMAQYPSGTELVYSNFTARSNAKLNVPDEYKNPNIIFFGLQGVLQDIRQQFKDNFFEKEVDEVLAEFRSVISPFIGDSTFNYDTIKRLHNLGYLPIEVIALPEGTRVPIGVPVFTIHNTIPEFYWLTNFLETWLSAELWKMCNSATIADVYKRMLMEYAKETGGDVNFVQWQAHDFSMRGMGNIEDAAKSGAGHLTSFFGTDALPAVEYLNEYYKGKDTFIGGSVPATEHSVMCLSGVADEIGTFKRLITEVYPTGVVSIVSDTWDYWKVITEYLPKLKDVIMSRNTDSLGLAKVVIRPDSGNPVNIICGYTESEIYEAEKDGIRLTEAEIKGSIECMWEIFGGTISDNGYRILDSHIGLIYGDSITPHRAYEILQRLKEKKFASTNVVFGIGSFTYQYNTRDTLGFAMKATYGVVSGEERIIYKDPKTDNGTKRSAKGLLKVVKDGSGMKLVDQQTWHNVREEDNLMKTVFLNGHFLSETSIEDIRRLILG